MSRYILIECLAFFTDAKVAENTEPYYTMPDKRRHNFSFFFSFNVCISLALIINVYMHIQWRLSIQGLITIKSALSQFLHLPVGQNASIYTLISLNISTFTYNLM